MQFLCNRVKRFLMAEKKLINKEVKWCSGLRGN